MLDPTIADHFAAGPGYLNTASVGLPPKAALEAMRMRIAEWEAGGSDPPSFDADVDRSRAAFARISGADTSSVGIVGQVSVISGLVASCLPDGAVVLAAQEDFTSVLFPFLADKRLDVRLVPLDRIIDSIDGATDLIAVSAVQSADGRVIDLDQLASSAVAAGARTYVDVTQAAGWLPLAVDRFDVTSCGAYKWLCSYAVRDSSPSALIPSGSCLASPVGTAKDMWQSIYGPSSARRRRPAVPRSGARPVPADVWWSCSPKSASPTFTPTMSVSPIDCCVRSTFPSPTAPS